MITWKRFNKKGYEVSTKGDERFSAFNAKINDHSIEWYYQVMVKGYDSIKEGKGKPPVYNISREFMYFMYKKFWVWWFKLNPELLMELKELAEQHDNCLTDMFATSEINQARALSEIINLRYFSKEK